tara:strand:+ start:178 stop:549 length:372 start_codon:yes stop_codon:yes gene_type:complete
MTYIPTQADIEWTLTAINGRIVWAVPSVGCVILLHHDTNTWMTYMKSNPTELETHNYEKIETNLNVIGYHEESAKIIGQAKNVDDVLVILLAMISKTEEQKELDAFWTRVKNTVSKLLGELGL